MIATLLTFPFRVLGIALGLGIGVLFIALLFVAVLIGAIEELLS